MPSRSAVPGAQLPLPLGGKVRQIMVDLDPKKLYAWGISPGDISTALNQQNVILPSGTAKIGTQEYPIVLMPVSRRPAFPLGSLDFAERFLNMAPCSAITLLGLPVVVVRAGTTSEGLPAGVQIVGRPFADHEVLAVARRLEDA